MGDGVDTFIKGVEIWGAKTDPTTLELINGFYGGMEDFKNLSEKISFAYDRGLPGKTWKFGGPQVLTQFAGSYFERTEAAHAAGITAAIALPILAGQCLMGVVVFLCGESEDNAGAIEVWHCDTQVSDDLKLMSGYFGALEHFEFVSKHMSFRRGIGLPGIVWDAGLPVLMNDLGKSHRFTRYQDAQDAGITTGLGIPIGDYESQIYVMTFLSAKNTPIARRIDIWRPNIDGVTWLSGYADSGKTLNYQADDFFIAKGRGTIGKALLTGRPVLSAPTCAKDAPINTDLSALIAIPVLQNGICRSVVSMGF